MKYKKRHLLLAGLLPIFYFVVNFLSNKPDFIEKYYSNGIYPKISAFWRLLLGYIPFSVGELLIFILLLLLIYRIYKLFKCRFKTLLRDFIQLTALLSVIYFCFYFFWGLNYFRKPLAENIHLKTSDYTTEELIHTTEKIIEKLNKIHYAITQNDTVRVAIPYSIKEIFPMAVNGYTNISRQFPQLKYEHISIKKPLVSLLHMYNGTSGYVNPITGEAQINTLISKNQIPFVTCHEMAHQIGWSAENEANFVGFLAAIHNDDIYFQYSGYQTAMKYLLRELRKRNSEAYKQLLNSLNQGILKDFNYSYNLWKQYENPIEPYIKKGYNSYLKANKQANGIKSYNYVVDLIISYEKQTN